MANPHVVRLEELRSALLVLHKALVDAERAGYERTLGAIASPTHFLQLLTHDPWFAWLQPLSRFIVSLDELAAQPDPLTAEMLEQTTQAARRLLTPTEEGEGFGRHYFEALQADAAVVIAHVDAMCLLRGPRGEKPGAAPNP